MRPLWFSVTSKYNSYNGSEDKFLDVKGEPWAKNLLEVYDEVKAELLRYLDKNEMVPYW